MSKMSQMAMEIDEAQAETLLEELESAAASINVGDKTESNEKTNIVAPSLEKKVQKKNEEKDSASTMTVFRTFVKNNKLAVKNSDGSYYLKAEAWLFLAHLKGVVPSVEIVPVYGDFNEIVRCTAVCKLYDKEGNVFSQATMIASKNEQFLRNLDDYAVVGMAQTRAITRCLRNVFGYFAKAAGYESTPAVEVGLETDVTL